jgi:hypothetical protein
LNFVLLQRKVFQIVPKRLIDLCGINHVLVSRVAWSVLKAVNRGVYCGLHVLKMDFLNAFDFSQSLDGI